MEPVPDEYYATAGIAPHGADEVAFYNRCKLAKAVLVDKLPQYWRSFLAVMGYAGLRRGEAAGLTWDAVDFDNRIIHVRANKY